MTRPGSWPNNGVQPTWKTAPLRSAVPRAAEPDSPFQKGLLSGSQVSRSAFGVKRNREII
jgi:hypothetical protein